MLSFTEVALNVATSLDPGQVSPDQLAHVDQLLSAPSPSHVMVAACVYLNIKPVLKIMMTLKKIGRISKFLLIIFLALSIKFLNLNICICKRPNHEFGCLDYKLFE